MRSVKSRLALLFTGIAALIVVAQAASLYLWVRRSLSRELDQLLEVQARMFHERFLEEYDEFRRGTFPDLNAELAPILAAGRTTATVRAADGSLLCATPGLAPGVPGGTGRVRIGGVPHRIRTDVLRTPDGASFTVVLGVSEEGYERQLDRIGLYFLFFCPLVLGVCWMLGYLFVGRALAPIEQMRRQAERISRENLSERVPVPRSTGEFNRLARTFNEMLDRLDRAFQDLQHFAADAAHELRTPLATLRAEIETAVQQARSPEEYERILGSAAEEVARMSRIVSDLLTLARLDMRQYVLRREPVPLRPLLEDVRETWQPAAEARRITIDPAADDATVPGDPGALNRVFMNLVENAVKYNRDGGRVSLAVARDNGTIRVRVEDTGIGIAVDQIPSLFRRFSRIDSSRSRESGGSGLGLAICKSLVEAHGGRIAVDSAPGRGTAFTVELPAAG